MYFLRAKWTKDPFFDMKPTVNTPVAAQIHPRFSYFYAESLLPN